MRSASRSESPCNRVPLRAPALSAVTYPLLGRVDGAPPLVTKNRREPHTLGLADENSQQAGLETRRWEQWLRGLNLLGWRKKI